MNISRKEWLTVVLLIVVAAMSRLVPYIIPPYANGYNFTPLVGIALFGGYYVKNRKIGFMIPLLAYFLSDLVMTLMGKTGFYGYSQFFVYGGMLLVTVLGSAISSPKAVKLLGFALGGAAVFFIVSNFGVWVGSKVAGSIEYEPGLTLSMTYIRALPFYNEYGDKLFQGFLVSSVLFTGLIFGVYALLKKSVLPAGTAKAI